MLAFHEHRLGRKKKSAAREVELIAFYALVESYKGLDLWEDWQQVVVLKSIFKRFNIAKSL